MKSVSSWTNFFLSKVHFNLDIPRSEIWLLLDTKWTRYKHSKKTQKKTTNSYSEFSDAPVVHEKETGANKKYYKNKSNCFYIVIEHVLHEQGKSNAINMCACSWEHFFFISKSYFRMTVSEQRY